MAQLLHQLSDGCSFNELSALGSTIVESSKKIMTVITSLIL